MIDGILSALLVATVATSMIIPRAGTKLGSVPITLSIVLYGMLCVAWLAVNGIRVRFPNARSTWYEFVAHLGPFAFIIVGILCTCTGILNNADPALLAAEAVAFVGFVPMYYLTKAFITDTNKLDVVVRIIGLGTFLVLVYGLLQRILGHTTVMIPGITMSYADAVGSNDPFALKNNVTAIGLKLTSTFQNGNLYGNFLVLIIPILLAVAVTSSGRRHSTFLLLFTLGMINLLLTLSRGAIIAGALALLLLAWFMRPSKLPIAIAGFMLIIGSIMSYVLKLGERLFVYDPTAAGRTLMWKNVVAAYESIPGLQFGIAALLGNGFGGAIRGSGMTIASTESSILILLMKTGLLGTALFLVSIWAIGRYAIAQRQNSTGIVRAVCLGGYAGLIGAVVHASIDSVMMAPPTSMNIWIVAGITAGAASLASKKRAFGEQS